MNTYSLAQVFADHMVLQRDKPVKIWGSWSVEQTLLVSLNGITREAACTSDNKWVAEFPPMEATLQSELFISSDHPDAQDTSIRNVAIGEVWIAGGQSNMEFLMKFDAESTEMIASADHPYIRFFDQPKISYEGEEKKRDYSQYGIWRVCDKENASYYSAVAFYFAKQLFETLHVPIGILGCNYGGTSASAWLHEDELAKDNELSVYISEYEETLNSLDSELYEQQVEQEYQFLNAPHVQPLLDAYMAGTLSDEVLQQILSQGDFPILSSNMGPKSKNRPGGLFHKMVMNIAGYSARGVIWYQGEQDEHKHPLYSKLFSSVINCWREAWQDPLPFIFVQLAPFRRWFTIPCEHFTEIRQQQERVSQTVDGAYMVSIMDAGMEVDIHPKRKRPVGERLALMARGKIYGENILCEPPSVSYATKAEDKVTLWFEHTGTGLFLKGDKIQNFQLFVGDREVVDYSLELSDNCITIQSEELICEQNIHVRHAWHNFAEVNLYNSSDLSAKPFSVTI